MYFVDKTENNPAQIAGHPAWGSEFSVSGDIGRAMDVITNSFCAVSSVLTICGVHEAMKRSFLSAGRWRAGQWYLAQRRG